MNKFSIAIGLILFLIIIGGLIGSFFDIQPEYYIPYLAWGVSLCVFSLFLNNNYENIYLKEL